jgi:hypothetical protein
MTKPRPGYKVIQPPFPPHLSGGMSTVTPFTTGSGPVTGTVVGFQRGGAPPPLQSDVYHTTAGYHQQQGHTGVSVSIQCMCVIESVLRDR